MSETQGTARPNIRQVAAIAGVSHMTVSRVLNNHPNIRPDTRRRVLEVIEELNYRPNNAARALATQRSRRIGVLLEATSAYGPTSALRGVEQAGGEAGYSVTSVTRNEDNSLPLETAIERLKDQGVDAMCVIAPRSTSISALRKLVIGLPVLVVKAEGDPDFMTLSVDQQVGTTLVVDHLVGLGHRAILHLAGPRDWLDARSRERAFHARTRELRLPELPIAVGDWTADFGYDFAKRIKRRPDYTAIFVANDEMALGLLHGLAERGIDVPGDLSVIGFDDIPLAAHFLPPLTTVRQDFHAVGVRVLEVLVAAAEGRDVPRRTELPVELVIRESASAPRSV